MNDANPDGTWWVTVAVILIAMAAGCTALAWLGQRRDARRAARARTRPLVTPGLPDDGEELTEDELDELYGIAIATFQARPS